jgi:origin recognition complex subunit 6
MAGMEAIVVPHGRRTSDEWVNGNLTSLLGALYVYVWRSITSTEGIDESQYVKAGKEVVRTLCAARESLIIKGAAEEKAWDGWQDVGVKDLDAAALWINRHGWLESDWAKGIGDVVHSARGHGPDEDEDDDEMTGDVRLIQIKRADTKFQDQFNLSETKRAEYNSWKRGILKRITELERDVGGEMETDS